MSDKTTTIVVLSYNAKDITERFIELLYRNTINFHLIMIDNGSNDGTVEYLDETLSMFGCPYFENEQVTFVANKENLGVIGGRNMGFALYQSHPTDYLCFLDNDQFVISGWLDQYIEFMEKHDADIIGADAWLMNEKLMPIYNCKKDGDPYSYVGCGGMLLKRHVVENVGFFDEQFNPAYFEDPDFNFRALQKGYKIKWNSDARIKHLPHQTLGKNPSRLQIFKNSYEKFKTKWAGYKSQVLR